MPRKVNRPTQLTLRGLEPDLELRVRELADAEGISLNKAALRLLRKGAGLDRAAAPDTVGPALDPLIGTWTEAQAREFQEAVVDLDRVDEELWR